MSDPHSLPLRGHDLPEVVPTVVRARVYRREDGRWTWEHWCPWHGTPVRGVDTGYYSQKIAFMYARMHVRGCL